MKEIRGASDHALRAPGEAVNRDLPDHQRALLAVWGFEPERWRVATGLVIGAGEA